MSEMKFESGQKLVSQGEKGSEYFILKEGQCTVTISSETENKQKIISEGEGFGEVALLYNAVRTATI